MITAINNISFLNNQHQKTNRIYPMLRCDRISFGQKDLLNEPKEKIFETIKASCNEKNFLGDGFEATVFKIDGTNYCYRRVHEDFQRMPKEISFDLTEQEKINHITAKIGNNGSSIMKYIEGSPVLTPSMPISKQKQIQKEIEQMPVLSFHKLLKQICHAYENNMVFDCHWANVIVNPKTLSLTAIDFNELSEYDHFDPLSYMYSSLTHADSTLSQKQNCAGKILLAGLQEFEPEVKPCLNPECFDFSRIIHKLFDNKVIENQKYKDVMVKLFSDIKDAKYAEIRNPNNSKELNGKLKVAKSLIKQLLLK